MKFLKGDPVRATRAGPMRHGLHTTYGVVYLAVF